MRAITAIAAMAAIAASEAGGERYDDGWREGKPQGRGIYTTAAGEIYEGAWHDGCLSDRDGRRAWLGSEAAMCGFE